MKTLSLAAALLLCAPACAEKPPAPQLLAPANALNMTDVATFFRWTPIKNITRYEIQIARDRACTDVFKAKITRNVRYHEDCYFPKEVLPPGEYFWRVRALPENSSDAETGPWSEVYSVKVNGDHAAALKMVREISAENPLFLMRNRAFDPRKVPPENLKSIFPGAVALLIVPDDIALWNAGSEALERARRYEELGLDFVIWNNRARAPLSYLEYCFQNFKHCIGTAEGEHFWSYGWEKGPEGNLAEWDYLRRAYVLCGKYGRYYFQGDGEPTNYKWTLYSRDYAPELARYKRNIVPMFKSTIGMVTLHSLGAVQGLAVSGTVENCGYWADEFIWKESGFGKLGEFGAPNSIGKGTELCPWTYDIQMWLMGIAGGATVFQLESAHQWKTDGTANANYRRYFLPFVTAVQKHNLIPSRRAYFSSLKVAVSTDYERAKTKHQNEFLGDFAFLREIYALKNTPFQEVIPDNSRYGIVPLLPPGAAPLSAQTQVLSLAQLAEPGAAKKLFDAAYPQRSAGEAFQWECDGTVIVTNANENRDAAQDFALNLARGPVRKISGSIGVHQYIVGKIAPDNRSFWLQTNGEYPERTLQIEFICAAPPRLEITPAAAKIAEKWDATRQVCTLSLSLKDGPTECTLRL